MDVSQNEALACTKAKLSCLALSFDPDAPDIACGQVGLETEASSLSNQDVNSAPSCTGTPTSPMHELVRALKWIQGAMSAKELIHAEQSQCQHWTHATDNSQMSLLKEIHQSISFILSMTRVEKARAENVLKKASRSMYWAAGDLLSQQSRQLMSAC